MGLAGRLCLCFFLGDRVLADDEVMRDDELMRDDVMR